MVSTWVHLYMSVVYDVNEYCTTDVQYVTRQKVPWLVREKAKDMSHVVSGCWCAESARLYCEKERHFAGVKTRYILAPAPCLT
jgi:hypothetical protein